VTARLVGELADHLTEDGEAFVLVSSRQDPVRLTEIRESWTRNGGRVEDAETRDLEGERLTVWRLTRVARPPTCDVPRT